LGILLDDNSFCSGHTTAIEWMPAFRGSAEIRIADSISLIEEMPLKVPL
jgi:hypothetical protein